MSPESTHSLKVGDVLDEIESHPFITVSVNTPLEEVAAQVRKHPDARSIFVKDESGHLKGAISIGRLIRTLTATRTGGEFSTRRLMRCLTCSHAGDIMTKELLFATPDQQIDEVIDRMLQGNIKEIPVLDKKGNIISNAGILDLWSRI